MGPPQGGAFLESPKKLCGSLYDPAAMNDVDTFARAGQYFDRDGCEHLAAQSLCKVFGLPNSVQGTELAAVEKGKTTTQRHQACFCSIVQDCSMTTQMHFNQRIYKGK